MSKLADKDRKNILMEYKRLINRFGFYQVMAHMSLVVPSVHKRLGY